MSSHSCSIRFRRATASGGWAATSAASSSADVLGRGRRGDAVDEAEPQRLVGADRARGEQQVLGGGEAAEGDQAGRADRDAERGAGEAHPQVGAADAHVAGDRDLGAAADDVAVAGGDRRLREGDDAVVEVGEELHPADVALVVELLADVGAGGEAHVVGGGEHEHPHRLVVAGDARGARAARPASAVSIALRRLGAVEAEQRDALLVDLVGGQARLSSLTRRLRNASRSTKPLGLLGGVADQFLDLGGGLAEAPEHVGGDDLGVGRVGPADADPDPPEVGAAEAAFEALEAVVAGQAAAEAGAGSRRRGGRSRRGRRSSGRAAP